MPFFFNEIYSIHTNKILSFVDKTKFMYLKLPFQMAVLAGSWSTTCSSNMSCFSHSGSWFHSDTSTLIWTSEDSKTSRNYLNCAYSPSSFQTTKSRSEKPFSPRPWTREPKHHKLASGMNSWSICSIMTKCWGSKWSSVILFPVLQAMILHL